MLRDFRMMASFCFDSFDKLSNRYSKAKNLKDLSHSFKMTICGQAARATANFPIKIQKNKKQYIIDGFFFEL